LEIALIFRDLAGESTPKLLGGRSVFLDYGYTKLDPPIKTMAVLYLSVDCGGSQTKIVYQLSGQESPGYLLMSPLVEEIKPEKIASYLDRKSSLGSPAPDREAYLKWQERVFVVGDLAREFDPEDRTSEQKYENALYKVAAAIGVIMSKLKLKLGKKKLELHLGVLIPWDEYNDRSIFEERLRKILAGFEFRGVSLFCSIGSILVRPEGGGVAATYIRKNGTDWLHEKKIAVLMFGHRNVTALYFDRGKLSGDSPLLGFTNFLDAVMERKSVDRELLSNAVMDTIARAYDTTHAQDQGHNSYPDWAKYPPIKGLARAKDVELNERECKSIVDAITVATKEYWEKIEKWLGKTIPHDVDVVIISGGAAEFLEPDLEVYFNAAHGGRRENNYSSWKRIGIYLAKDEAKPMPELLWGIEIIKLIREKFKILEDKDDHNMAIRLVDCYGLFDYLIGSMEGK
jgi:hypothetical protein